MYKNITLNAIYYYPHAFSLMLFILQLYTTTLNYSLHLSFWCYAHGFGFRFYLLLVTQYIIVLTSYQYDFIIAIHYCHMISYTITVSLGHTCEVVFTVIVIQHVIIIAPPFLCFVENIDIVLEISENSLQDVYPLDLVRFFLFLLWYS